MKTRGKELAECECPIERGSTVKKERIKPKQGNKEQPCGGRGRGTRVGRRNRDVNEEPGGQFWVMTCPRGKLLWRAGCCLRCHKGNIG